MPSFVLPLLHVVEYPYQKATVVLTLYMYMRESGASFILHTHREWEKLLVNGLNWTHTFEMPARLSPLFDKFAVEYFHLIYWIRQHFRELWYVRAHVPQVVVKAFRNIYLDIMQTYRAFKERLQYHTNLQRIIDVVLHSLICRHVPLRVCSLFSILNMICVLYFYNNFF